MDEILFIDGFAGPGRYETGEDGSPIIALKAFRDHASRPRITGAVRFLFVELDKGRVAALREEVAALSPPMPRNAEINIFGDRFDTHLTASLDRLEEDGLSAVPLFCMADPFGVGGIPLKLFARILRHRSSELFITVMGSFIRRFAERPEMEPNLIELYGGEEWRPMTAIADADERVRYLLALYEKKLRDAGATYVIRFDLFDGSRYVYSIFFATNNDLGCEKMKDAVWKVVPDGGFEYHDRDRNQLTLDVGGPNIPVLERQILELLASRGTMTTDDLDSWARGDGTLFRRSRHLRDALRSLEKRTAILVDRGGIKQFGSGVQVRLAP